MINAKEQATQKNIKIINAKKHVTRKNMKVKIIILLFNVKECELYCAVLCHTLASKFVQATEKQTEKP